MDRGIGKQCRCSLPHTKYILLDFHFILHTHFRVYENVPKDSMLDSIYGMCCTTKINVKTNV